MSVYASLVDMLARFPEAELVQLTDEAGAGMIDEPEVAQAVASAGALIDAYLAKAYQLPLAVAHPVLVDLACALARFNLWQKRGSPTETVEKGQAAALKTLREIAQGLIKIDAGAEQLPPRDGAVLMGGGEAVFTRERMKGF